MARFLVATHPITGHALPGIPIVAELVRRGHDVHWYVGAKFRAKAEQAGATFEPYEHALDYDDSDYDAAFPGRRALSGLRQLSYDFRKVFVEQVSGQHHDLTAILERFPADATLGDTAMIAPFSVNERGGPPNAVYNVTCLGIPGRGIAPFGLGLLPDDSPKGLVRNRILAFSASNIVFAGVSRELERQCRAIGVAPRKFAGPTVSDFLYLQPSVPSFEYARPDLAPQVHYVGALLSPPPVDPELPDWWPDVVTSTRPVVLVTQGTVATGVRDLVAPTLLGLADEDVLVVAAGVPDLASLGLPRVPANARVATYLPFSEVMEHVSVYVTNGGTEASSMPSAPACRSWRPGPPRTSPRSGTGSPTAASAGTCARRPRRRSRCARPSGPCSTTRRTAGRRPGRRRARHAPRGRRERRPPGTPGRHRPPRRRLRRTGASLRAGRRT